MHQFSGIPFLFLAASISFLQAGTFDFKESWYSPIQVAFDFSDNMMNQNITLNDIDNEETSAIAENEPPFRLKQRKTLSKADETAAFIRILVLPTDIN